MFLLKNIVNYIFKNPIYNKIFDNVWIGNKHIVKDMKIYQSIDVIINCSNNIPFYNTSKVNHRISINNVNSLENIKNLETYLEMSADLIKYHIDQNKKILIHCDTSVNLSPSILVAYIIKYKNKNLYEACNIILDKHPIAFFIEPKFKISLINYEYNILKKNHKNISYIHLKKFKIFWFSILTIIIILIIIIYKLIATDKSIATTKSEKSIATAKSEKSIATAKSDKSIATAKSDKSIATAKSNDKIEELSSYTEYNPYNEFLDILPKKLIYDFRKS